MAKTPVEYLIEQQKNISEEVPQEQRTIIYIKDGIIFRPFSREELAPIKIMVYDPSKNEYTLIEGYEGEKNLTWDSNGNLTEITMKIIKEDGTTITVKRTFTYDENGNLISVSDWILVQ